MPHFTNNSVSVGKLCNAGCRVIFTSTAVSVFNAMGTLILQGIRELIGPKMWRFNINPATANNVQHTPLPACPPTLIHNNKDNNLPIIPTPSPTHGLHSPNITTLSTAQRPHRSTECHRKAYDLPSTRTLIKYLHATDGSPVKDTLLKAVKNGNYRTWPRLTLANVTGYCPNKATPTVMGHMIKVSKGLRSTRTQPTSHPRLGPLQPANKLHYFSIPFGTLYTDGCGKFPIRAHSGNQYIMVGYHVIANAILIEAFKTKHDSQRIPAYNNIMGQLQVWGIIINNQVLDNEASMVYQNTITNKWGYTYQLVPPDMHQQNAAKRAIKTFKAHFLSVLATVDPGFPASWWDLLLPQAKLTLNLLQQSHYD
jgi:hypothetical protein